MFELMLGLAEKPFKSIEYPYSGPGNKWILAGDENLGYFGEVPSSEIITYQGYYDHLKPVLKGSLNVDDQGWFKFFYKKKVIYISKRMIAKGVSWNALYAVGGVYGTNDNGIFPYDGEPLKNQYRPLTIDDDTFSWKLIPRLPSMSSLPEGTSNGENQVADTYEYASLLGRVIRKNGIAAGNYASWFGKWASNDFTMMDMTGQNLGKETQKPDGGASYYTRPINRGHPTVPFNPTGATKTYATVDAPIWRGVLELEGYSMPLKDEWSSLPDLVVAATQGHSVTVIDNLAYIYGGTYAGTTLLRSLNLDTGEVKTLKAGSTPRTRHTAVAIGRKIYFYGGYNSTNTYIGTLHSYDVDTDTWVTNLTAGTISDRHAAGVLNGRMYASGGTADKTPVPTNLREYNPITDRWTNIQSGHGTDPVCGVTVDNDFYIIGGLNVPSGQQFKKVSGADITTTTFLPGVADNRHSMAVAAAKHGIYLFGGHQLGAAVTALVQRYDIVTQLWSTLKPMPIPVGERGAAVSYKNKIYLIGGNGTAAKKVQVYTP